MSSLYLATVDAFLRNPHTRHRTCADLRRELDAYADEERREAAKAIAHPDRPLLAPPSAPPNHSHLAARETAPPPAATP
ncbi:TAP transporter inhibitor ICP47 [Cercopithecine alphaherpesvirus 2]|uniref:ICP47 protein n=2 Tax=Simplexvirus TaxID=10294 RepID=ICP47_HSV2S|nr:TAP transporter inhibitor ICP47 [Cercopithecine alphaherpesvirus 2]P60504.1 RecName: Full=ICP47 protein; AltName: Full=Immediate-early protein IE12; AltName: Full=Immediate-early-5; AltName: Full=Infected cell protein 47; AltName: Full=US12 protein; AltName: Full=Vmw12 [Human herpesvirus 2 strain SA8]AAQ90018.1 ICP47 [Cercopithecine alphaherpesvirus 2]AAU88138.1 immediate early protein ICP47 [Cercopithecine alphaherpesvirus 2]